MMTDDQLPATLDWLMEGDPAIRWQVMRDLLDAPKKEYEKERAKVAVEGWGARLLSKQDADGTWGGGIYSPKWKSTTYTLLLLRHLGLPAKHPQALRGCERFWDYGLYPDGGINFFKSFHHSETCINGMLLALLSYFHYEDDRIHSIVEFLKRDQMPDGGWNCDRVKGATHASFHSTLSVLEGLDEYRIAYPRSAAAITSMIDRAHEFLLIHRVYRSHRTGKVADPAMTRMYFPPRWRFDFIRALDYFRSVDASKDDRMQDAIDLLTSKQKKNGRWVMNTPWAGLVYFKIEEAGKDSRWNTLRALRVLKWWNEKSG